MITYIGHVRRVRYRNSSGYDLLLKDDELLKCSMFRIISARKLEQSRNLGLNILQQLLVLRSQLNRLYYSCRGG
jgi:hypothetical protein